MLLEEIQHRVANSLQIIASILLIKARTVQSEETRLQLQDAHRRVLSVAAVQQHLYRSDPTQPIEIATYLTKLCETLAQSMIGDSRPISLKVEADTGTAPSRDAVSLGLIVTELVMNALKHAFPGEKPGAAIVVSYNVADSDWKLTVSDNGVGKPDVRAGDGKSGLGTSLIQALAKQLDARVEIVTNSTGTAVSMARTTFSQAGRQAGRGERDPVRSGWNNAWSSSMNMRTSRKTVTFHEPFLLEVRGPEPSWRRLRGHDRRRTGRGPVVSCVPTRGDDDADSSAVFRIIAGDVDHRSPRPRDGARARRVLDRCSAGEVAVMRLPGLALDRVSRQESHRHDNQLSQSKPQLRCDTARGALLGI